jgi:hypothetical protein
MEYTTLKRFGALRIISLTEDPLAPPIAALISSCVFTKYETIPLQQLFHYYSTGL